MKSKGNDLHVFGVKMINEVRAERYAHLKPHLVDGALAELRANLFMQTHENWEKR